MKKMTKLKSKLHFYRGSYKYIYNYGIMRKMAYSAIWTHKSSLQEKAPAYITRKGRAVL